MPKERDVDEVEEETTEGHAPGSEFPGTSWAELNEEDAKTLNETGTLPPPEEPDEVEAAEQPEQLR